MLGHNQGRQGKPLTTTHMMVLALWNAGLGLRTHLGVGVMWPAAAAARTLDLHRQLQRSSPGGSREKGKKRY